MDDAENDVLAYMGLPATYWAKVHSTNPLERLDREIKRRSNVVSIFPNACAAERTKAVIRLDGAILLEQNGNRATQRRCMILGTLAPVSDDPAVSLPAAAT